MSRRRCPAPAPPPLDKFPNCPVCFTRACSDGTGTVKACIDGAYLFTSLEDGETPEEAQIRADELAFRLAKGRALQMVLICNTLSPEDLADCGRVEQRPVVTTNNAILTESSIPISTEDGDILITE